MSVRNAVLPVGSARTIDRTRLTQQTYDVLCAMILARELLPGARIEVARLAEQLGVSRTPLKEAVNQLAAQGIVEIRPQHGTFVAPVDWVALKELHEVSLIVDTSACAALAGKLSLQSLAELRGLLAEMELQTDGQIYRDYTQYLKLDRDYHTAIVRLTGNRHLLRMYEGIGLQLRVARDFAHAARVTGAADNLAEHREMFHALVEGDPERARRAAADHLRNGFERVCARLAIEPNGLLFDWEQPVSARGEEMGGRNVARKAVEALSLGVGEQTNRRGRPPRE